METARGCLALPATSRLTAEAIRPGRTEASIMKTWLCGVSQVFFGFNCRRCNSESSALRRCIGFHGLIWRSDDWNRFRAQIHYGVPQRILEGFD